MQAVTSTGCIGARAACATEGRGMSPILETQYPNNIITSKKSSSMSSQKDFLSLS
ncbi:hypothetical protein HPP92_011781 [Vanilla planifolia]|uniref:Uncharacterized protein n=1 Tax=Vanilla planifolia TaxID=51239 RepID=A0A835V349_VANPL|nr:hypothetical protein HPP92_011781 [Vanilla planifolia]